MSDSTRGPLTWIAWLALAVLAGLAALSFFKPAEEAAPAGPAPPCPTGFVDRPAVGEQLLAALADTDAAALVADAERLGPRFCFGAIESPSIMAGRVLLLTEGGPTPALAARVGHLLHHAVHGSPFPERVEPDADCEQILETAIAREAAAFALEVELRAELDVEPNRYDFEASVIAARPEARADVVARYLLAHPDGGRNVEPLITAYRQRCEIERAEAE